MRRWNTITGNYCEDKRIDAFIDEVLKVSRKHGYSISHEDVHGAFLIEGENELNYEWLGTAHRFIEKEE